MLFFLNYAILVFKSNMKQIMSSEDIDLIRFGSKPYYCILKCVWFWFVYKMQIVEC